MNEIRKFAIWMKDPLRKRVDDLAEWMEGLKNKSISRPDALRLLFKAWDSLTEKQKLKLMEGE